MAQVEFLPEDPAEHTAPPIADAPRGRPVGFRIGALVGWGVAVVLLGVAPFCATVLVTVESAQGRRTGALANGWGTVGGVLRASVHLERFGIALYLSAALIVVAIAATLMRRHTIARLALVAAPSALVGTVVTMGLALQTYVDEFAAAGVDAQRIAARYGACMWLTVIATAVAIAASILAFMSAARTDERVGH
jgi:hypothetical protein